MSVIRALKRPISPGHIVGFTVVYLHFRKRFSGMIKFKASDDEPYNVLGEERDVTKGMAAMLKLAAEKGYLDSGKTRKVNGPSLKHLENKRFSQIEVGK